MNPNMFGPQMGQMQNAPTEKDLWKNEKDKYRVWVVILAVAIAALLAMSIIAVTLNFVNQTSIRDSLADYAKNGEFSPSVVKDHDPGASVDGPFPNTWAWWAKNTFWYKVVPYSIVAVALLAIVAIAFAITIVKSYKEKSFRHLSGAVTMILGLGAIYSFFQLIQLIWTRGGYIFSYPEGIFTFILYVLFILTWLFASRQLSKIRRAFIIAFRIEAFKNSPQYQQMQEQMQAMQNGNVNPAGMGPFGPMSQPQPSAAAPTPGAAPTGAAQPQPVKRELTAAEKRTKELQKMKLVELQEVAKRLSLSGYKTMKKDELIKNIVRITEDN